MSIYDDTNIVWVGALPDGGDLTPEMKTVWFPLTIDPEDQT